MPEKFDNLLDTSLSSADDSLGSKLQREAELLRDGLSSGVVNRVTEMWEHKGQTALTLGGCAGLGAALSVANRLGGRWAVPGKILSGALLIGAGYDVVNRGAHTLGAVADTWNSPNANMHFNKELVAKYAGSALVDYPLMIAAGYGGHTLGRVRGFGVKLEVGNFAREIKVGDVRMPEPTGTRPFEFNVTRTEVPAKFGDMTLNRWKIPTVIPTELAHPAIELRPQSHFGLIGVGVMIGELTEGKIGLHKYEGNPFPVEDQPEKK